ncbi:MAG: Uma2 family endonuclease [Acetatifactor sp.]
MTLEEMKRIKQEKGYSLAQLSDYSGVPLGTLQKIFSGETEHPRYATRQALEKALSDGAYREEKVTKGIAESTAYTADRPQKQGEYTLEDYYTLPDDRRVELIDGVIYDMSAPTFVHQHILGDIFNTIKNFIKDRNGSCMPMLAPVDVRLDCDDKTMVQPDILILCDKSKICKWGIMGAPDFCLEIISESTRRKDYIKKLQKYTDAGVKEYWIIDPFRKVLVTYCWKDDYAPHIQPLQGKAGLVLYDGELQIDLEEISSLIQDYPEGGRE